MINSKVDLSAFCEAFQALAEEHGATNLVVYVGSATGSVLTHSDITTLVAAEGAIRKKITEFKSQTKRPVDHDSYSEE